MILILFLLITVVRVFLTNPVMKRCLRYRAMDIPSDETNKQTNKQTKNLRVKEGSGTWQQQKIIMANISQIHLWIHHKWSSTSFKPRLLAECYRNSTLNKIIIFPCILLGGLGACPTGNVFLDLNSLKSPFLWVSESFIQDIGQIPNIFVLENLTGFRKRWKPVWSCACFPSLACFPLFILLAH